MFSPGSVVGRHFRLFELLGEGGMGSVWAARDERDGAEVALKFIKEAEDRADRRRRLIREARAAMSLGHPNVVRIHEVVEGPPPFIVMDLLRGESLASRLHRDRRIALPEFADIFIQVLSAVGAAHSAGIVHRDLKPANIFLADRDGRVEVRVLDFGIAKFTEQDLATASTNLTSTGDILGTPQYMAPEQIFGERDLDHRADVWALGIIAFECLAGRHPISGENIGQVLKAITTTTLPTLDVDVPTPVRQMVTRMMARERAVRPVDLREVVDVFRHHARLVVPAFGAPVATPSSGDEPAQPATADSIASVTSAPRRAIPSAFLVAVAGLAAAFGVGVAVSRRGPAPVGTPSVSLAPAPCVAPSPAPIVAPLPAVSVDAGTTSDVGAPIAPHVDAAVHAPAHPSATPAVSAPPKKAAHDEDI